MKIGILIRDFSSLKNFELRIIKEIIDRPDLDLCLLIKDGRKELRTLSSRIRKIISGGQILANIVFKLQCLIESKLFPAMETVDHLEVISRLESIKSIKLYPEKRGFVDVFSKEDSKLIKDFGLDIILRHEFNIIRGEILNSAKYGIWSFHHGDNAINRGGPAGFWEILLNEPYVGVTLQKLTSELDGGIVLDKAYYNWHWSYVKNANDIFEESVTLLFKNINLLVNGKLKEEKSKTYYNPLYRKPDIFVTLNYIFKFYKRLFFKILNKILYKTLKARSYCWSLFISEGNFLESTLYKINPTPLPKKEFWADPFLAKKGNNKYVFFENYDYEQKKGKISCGKINENNFNIEDIRDVLVKDYHLSYPFMVMEDEAYYMIPDCSANNRIEVYRCLEFPDRWELFSFALEGESVVDTSYFKDKNGNKWLFVNKGFVNKSELHIYRIDSLELNNIESHECNPVMVDSLRARNAGPIFQYDNEIYRPSQMSAYGIYGYGLNINKIKRLSLDQYEEQKVLTVKPNFIKGIIGIHHLHQMDDCFVFDSCFRCKY